MLTEDLNTEIIEFCPQGHAYQHLFEKPKSYSGKAMCDICERKDLSKNCEDGFYHCSICQWDKCLKCRTMPPIINAIVMNDLAEVQNLSKENDFEIEKKYDDFEDKTVFMKACKNGNLDIVKFLVSSGCAMAAKDSYHRTAFFNACACGNLNIVKYLKSVGYDIYETDDNDQTCFHIASWNCQIDVVKYLVSLEEWDIHEKDQNGFTAFLSVCLRGNRTMMEYFISLGSKLDEMDNLGYTPFLLACCSNNLDAVNYLISLGCDINEKSNLGQSGYNFAHNSYNISLAILLLEYGCEITRSFSDIEKTDFAKEIDARIQKNKKFKTSHCKSMD